MDDGWLDWQPASSQPANSHPASVAAGKGGVGCLEWGVYDGFL